MSRLDAKGRIMAGDTRYGRLCDCGNLKNWQSRLCMACYHDTLRDGRYWSRRTCLCGSAKSARSARCLACAHEAKRGQPAEGRAQPAYHPWRHDRFAAPHHG